MKRMLIMWTALVAITLPLMAHAQSPLQSPTDFCLSSADIMKEMADARDKGVTDEQAQNIFASQRAALTYHNFRLMSRFIDAIYSSEITPERAYRKWLTGCLKSAQRQQKEFERENWK